MAAIYCWNSKCSFLEIIRIYHNTLPNAFSEWIKALYEAGYVNMRPGMWIWGRICEWALTHFIFHLKWRHRIRQESRLPMKTLLRWNIDVRISKSDLTTTRLETIQRLYLGSTGPNTVRNVYGAVVVAQLTERLLPIPDHPGSNPVIGNFYWTIYCQLLVEKTKIKRGNWTQDGRPWSTLGAGNEQPYWHCD